MSEPSSDSIGKPDSGDTVSFEQDDESLVAYLDGELPRDQRGELEQRLVSDETLRSRLQSFQKEWDLLDLLPSPETTEHSVQSTIELVVDDIRRSAISSVGSAALGSGALGSGALGSGALSSASSGVEGADLESVSVSPREKPAPLASRWRRSLWLIPLVFLLLAFGFVRWQDFQANQTQVLDFPVAVDMEVYSIAENTSLIDDLRSSTRWRRVVAGSVIPAVEGLIKIDGEHSLFAGRDLTVNFPSQDELTEKLASVSREERMIVLSRMERFEQLDPSAKDSLRQSAQNLRQLPDAQQRLNTLRAYARWREQLSDQLVSAIETEAGAAREEAIETAIAETITSIGRSTSRNLDNEAIERIDFTLRQIVKQRLDGERDSSNESAPTRRVLNYMKQKIEMRGDPNMVYRMIAARIVYHDRKREIKPLTTSELEMIQVMLPSKDAETLERYVDDPWVRALILEDWAQETVRRKSRGQTKSATLPELYQALPAEEREVLDLMPPEKSRRLIMESSP